MTRPAHPDLLSRRLRNQHVAGVPLERPEDVVHWLGAVQSQDYLGAKWSVGQRVRNGTDAAVERAFTAGAILRTHMLRPTWHFVAPADIRWMLRLTAPHVHALNAYSYRELELDETVFARSHRLLTRALEGGTELTRLELAAVLRRGGISARSRRLAYIMMHAELEGLVCSGAVRGKQHTYALLEERAPRAPALGRDEALAALARRFFTGHAPATLRHFVWWSGLSVANAQAGLARVEHELPHVVIGEHAWYGISERPARPRSTAAYLLPEYDEALVGSKDMAVPDLPRARGARPWKDTFLRPVILGGRRAGTWRRTIEREAVALELNLFAELDRAERRAIDAAAQRYGRFLAMPIRLEA